jgi:branched-chain amino acid transport system permease protein
VRTKLLAFALGASFSGFAGAFYAAKLQAIFPELFRFNLSIMILCMVILGGMGSIRGVIAGGLLIQLFDRVVLAQTTSLAQSLGRTLSIPELAAVDLGLWRWFFFGLTLVVIMVVRPEGLFPSAAGRRQLHVEDEDQAVPAPAAGST